jgi:hypothetical protein
MLVQIKCWANQSRRYSIHSPGKHQKRVQATGSNISDTNPSSDFLSTHEPESHTEYPKNRRENALGSAGDASGANRIKAQRGTNETAEQIVQ